MMKEISVICVLQISLSLDIFKVQNINSNERPGVILGDGVIIVFVFFVFGEFNLIVEDDKVTAGFSKINLSVNFDILNL